MTVLMSILRISSSADMMTQPAQLSGEDLLDRAHQLRLLALRGHLDTRGPAHEHARAVVVAEISDGLEVGRG